MKNKTIKISLAILLLCFFDISNLYATYFPEIQNGKGADFQQFPLGPIGGVIEIKFEETQAKIMSLSSSGPGYKYGLREGDIIYSVNGNPFSKYSKDSSTGGDGIPKELGEAILASQKSKKNLQIEVIRKGIKKTFNIRIPYSTDLLKVSCERLSKLQGPDGRFEKKPNEYSNSMAALALLASGNSKYKRRVKLFAHEIAKSVESNGPSQSHWHNSAIGIFLSEYILATGDHKVLNALRLCCKQAEKCIVNKDGLLGHKATKLPYDNKGLVITSAHVHLMWALASQVGISINDKKWELSYKSLKAATNKSGAVGYNFRAKGSYQAMARTGLTSTALLLAGKSKQDLDQLNNWISQNYKRATNCHAVASMGMIFGFMGLKNTNKEAYEKAINYHNWLFALVQPYNDNHGVYYMTKRGNWGGDKYLGLQAVANYQVALMKASEKNNTLWIFGNRKTAWFR